MVPPHASARKVLNDTMVVAWSSVKTLAMIRNVWRADVAIQGALHPTDAFARRVPVKGIPNSEGLPLIEGTPVPVVEHGGVLVERGAVGLEGGLTTRGVSVIRFANGLGARAMDGG